MIRIARSNARPQRAHAQVAPQPHRQQHT
jgi:hypothetical protein